MYTDQYLDIRVILKFNNVDKFKTWKPTWDEFDQVVIELVDEYAMSAAAESAMFATDEVLAHSILFIRDALLFREFSDAIRCANVGRMWMVYDFWVFMMRGAGCHNYGNEILETKAQFEHELPPALREVVERTWLVNRWGTKGCSIPTDLYLEHNNGFLKASAHFASAIIGCDHAMLTIYLLPGRTCLLHKIATHLWNISRTSHQDVLKSFVV